MILHDNSTYSHERAAKISGIALILMTIAAFFSFGYVHQSLFVIDDPTTTFSNLQEGKSLFQAGIIGWFIIIVTDLLVTWGFYTYLKSVNKTFTKIFSTLRLLYTLILSYAVYQLITITSLINPIVDNLKIRELQITEQINAFETIWSLGLILFGVHLFFVGLTTLQTDQIPKWIGVFLLIGGISYTLIHSLYNFAPDYESYVKILEMVLQVPMIIGELGFGLWLLLKGYKTKPKSH